jgi:polyisoprenoid-binding protein YceI
MKPDPEEPLMSPTQTPVQISELTAGTWAIDPSHSTVSFTARHMMVAKVRGKFTEFSGSVNVAENVLDSTIEATVQLASVDTGDENRDGHLRSPDFFDVENTPTMTFKSTRIEPDGDDYKLFGDLTVRNVTKPVEFKLEYNGAGADPWGGFRAGLTATTEINRKDWNLEWNVALETGGVLVSEKVKIELDVELIRPQA